MSASDEFFQKMLANNIVFSKEDYENFMKICNHNIENFEICYKNYDNKKYKLSKSFFGKSYLHPKNVNPYRVNYNITKIINELKLSEQNIKYKDKVDKIVNYVNYVR